MSCFRHAPIVLALLLGACASEAESSDCAPVGNVDALFEPGGPDIIILGELHGTQAAPALLADLVCHGVERGLSLGVLLEMPDFEGQLAKRIDGEAAWSDVAAHPPWSTDPQDGRASVAMGELIDTLARHDRNAVRVSFLTPEFDFDPDTMTMNDLRDAIEADMAQDLRGAAQGQDRTFMLVGSMHGRKLRLQQQGFDYRLMADHLPPDRTLSMHVGHGAGVAWNCHAEGCGTRKVAAAFPDLDNPERKSAEIIMPGDGRLDALAPDGAIAGYDGVVLVGPAVASPPLASQL